jgi:hypothetical protein
MLRTSPTADASDEELVTMLGLIYDALSLLRGKMVMNTKKDPHESRETPLTSLTRRKRSLLLSS